MSFSILFNRYDTLSSNKSKRSWFNQKQRKRKNFPIGEMPRLAMNLVIRSMDTMEQTMLSLTSKRMENCVRMAKVKVKYTFVYVQDELSRIGLVDDTVSPIRGVYLYCAHKTHEQDVLKVTREELAKWCNYNSIVENMINVFKKVEYIFQFKKFALIFFLDEMKETTVKEILSIPAFQSYTSLQFIGRRIDSDALNSIIDMAKSEQFFAIRCTEIPIDFKNENAFKFKKVEYADARWVKMEDLFSLCNKTFVKLGKNNFNSSHFNTFIKYWINNDCDMFKQLTIEVDEARNDFYDGLVVLKYSNYNPSSYLVVAKQNKNRKKPILDIWCGSDVLIMTAYSPDEQSKKWEEGPLITYKKEYDILRLLERKRELESEMVETERQEQEIREEIQELDYKLIEYGVYYEQGIPTIDRRNT